MEKIALKKIITHQNKWPMYCISLLIFLILYMGSGAISNQSGSYLPLLAWEEALPLIPWTIWIYMVYYPLFLVWSVLQIKDEELMNITLYSFALLTILSCAIFLILPISYPRGYYPLGPEQNLTNFIFAMTRAVDTPSNCLPSLHVGLCFLFTWVLFYQKKLFFGIALFSSILISISTLTTKQHYFYDLVAGFICATIVFFLIKKTCVVKSAQ